MAFIREWFLFKVGFYLMVAFNIFSSKTVAFIRGWFLFEGGFYLRAASIRETTVVSFVIFWLR